jgi:hypothetical protein
LFLIGRLKKIFSSETAWSNEPKLGSFGSFGQAVSEEKISKIGQLETRIACGSHVC